MKKGGLVALTPLFVFLALYLGGSVVAGDFYLIPIAVAFLVAAAVATLQTKGSMSERVDILSRGAGDKNMMLMFWIFILAGALSASASAMGAVDATVNLTLNLLPDRMIYAGFFIASCFISLAIGTSVGTIVALTPIAAGVARSTGLDLPFITAIVVGGSFFGDNLSFISDTTIIATQTQGCAMSDKFKVNSQIVLPVALLLLIYYFVAGSGVDLPEEVRSVEWVKVIPYLVVILLALAGMSVFVVLALGIFACGVVGIATSSFDVFTLCGAMGKGMADMGELIIITMLAGGMLELIRHNGGLDFIIERLMRRVKSKRGAELFIAVFTAITDLCVANNTVAIITSGRIAKEIADRFGVDPRKAASVLDTSSCFVQGVLPYGNQVLIATTLAGIAPLSIVPYLYYPAFIGVATLLAILFRYPRRYS